MSLRASLAVLLVVASGPVLPALQSSNVLVPGNTVVPVKLAQFISSETSATGDAVLFVVAEDVIVGGVLVIKRGTPARGTIVECAPYRLSSGWIWGPRSKRGHLIFTIDTTTAVDGHTVRLRGPIPHGVPPERESTDRQIPALVQWAHEGAMFDARVVDQVSVQRVPSP